VDSYNYTDRQSADKPRYLSKARQHSSRQGFHSFYH
jgi:hypothetical protein